MGQDCSAEVAADIAGSKVYGSSENIRHGKYKHVIRKCFSEKISTDKGDHKWSFIEVTPLTSEPNPQTEGDHVDYPGTAGPLKDDGRNPNAVGSPCALKVDHDGPGGRSAGSNIKAAILAVFNASDGQISDEEINKTWVDAARRKPCKAGDVIGFDAATQQTVKATEDKQSNPLCGVVVNCTTIPKRKKQPNDKGAYITKLIWSCASPLGTGENTAELIAKRRAEIEATQVDDDDDEVTPAAPGAPAPNGAQNGTAGMVAAPPPPPAPAPPPPPAAAVFTPTGPWTKHSSWGPTPETQWYYSDLTKGGDGKTVKSVAMLRAGQ